MGGISDELTRYTDDGCLRVDNNGAEQALRPIVLGRKNYLFAGSEAAAAGYEPTSNRLNRTHIARGRNSSF